MTRALTAPLLILAFTPGLVLAADPPADPHSAAAEEGAAQEQPAQSDPDKPALPPGHPQMTTRKPPAFELPPVPEDSGTGETSLSWSVPDGWLEEQPANAMRKAQYRLTGETGDAQLVVFYFGPGQGGGPMANCQRWAGQFMQPDGRPASEALKTAEIDANGIPVLTCEITGAYGGGMSMGMGRPAAPQENQMLLGAVAEGPDANWFFKLTGPRGTVEGNRAGFDGLVGSLKAGS